MRRRSVAVIASVAIAAALGACGEQLEGGAACPALCPAQDVAVLDTVFEPVVLDSTVGGFPTIGTDLILLLAGRGDTLDVRPVVRFDSLLHFYQKGGVDSVIAQIDSPYVRFRIDKANSRVTAPITIEAFDVDTVVGDSLAQLNDTTTSVERLLFRPDRRLGTVTLDTSQIGDSIRVPLDSARVEFKVLDKKRLRVGFKVTSTAPVQLHIVSREGGEGPILRYDPSGDTAIKHLSMFPLSKTPLLHPVIAGDLADYVHVILAPAPSSSTLLTVGGLPGRRVLLRFDIPSFIIDSSNVLRASLLLTQVPVRGLDDTTAFTVFPQLVTAGREITDVGRSAFLINFPGAGFDSIRVVPRDSGQRTIEMVNALRAWGTSVAVTAQRALVLRSSLEGLHAGMATYFSAEAAPGLRPRLRVSYSPLRNFGIP